MKDIYKDKIFYYELKNTKIKDLFLKTKNNKKKLEYLEKIKIM